jgi:hypothetical protein
MPSFLKGDSTADIHLSLEVKNKYSEIVPVLSGTGAKSKITLFGRRKDDASKLEQIISQAWKSGDAVRIVWDEGGTIPT